MSVFYRLVRFIFSNYNQLYFRRFRVVGKENIPNEGAILFSPNHQNALLDPLLVGTTAGKSIHSLTRSDVFGGPLQWFLDAMQTLPIYRMRDGYDQLKKNQAVFEQCYALLGDKKHMMMFSEGRHHGEHYLLRLSKGSSRLVLEAQLKHPHHPIYLQPVGLNYGNHRHAQNDCVVVYGKPIDVRAYVDRYQSNPAKGVNDLRDQLQAAMEACLWLPKNNALYGTKKPFINRKNTALSFEKLKAALEKDQPSLEKPTKKTTLHRFMIGLLSFPNLPLHLAVLWLIGQFNDNVFHGSMNYLGSLVFCLLWWALGIVAFSQAIDVYWGLYFFLISLSSLYIRQIIINRPL